MEVVFRRGLLFCENLLCFMFLRCVFPWNQLIYVDVAAKDAMFCCVHALRWAVGIDAIRRFTSMRADVLCLLGLKMVYSDVCKVSIYLNGSEGPNTSTYL